MRSARNYGRTPTGRDRSGSCGHVDDHTEGRSASLGSISPNVGICRVIAGWVDTERAPARLSGLPPAACVLPRPSLRTFPSRAGRDRSKLHYRSASTGSITPLPGHKQKPRQRAGRFRPDWKLGCRTPQKAEGRLMPATPGAGVEARAPHTMSAPRGCLLQHGLNNRRFLTSRG